MNNLTVSALYRRNRFYKTLYIIAWYTTGILGGIGLVAVALFTYYVVV